ncbi:P-loop containing nucleoside triphosphate hydrolase protein [Ochromonadaceae sp. CCMP2298]|nr:P-loop containing nucleoside triphosphate hydrolase protein [Ochromonadaceae sp. CCMP2298]
MLVKEPTRELALQSPIYNECLGKAHGIRVAAIYGGVRYENQIKDLRSGVQIIVATPGRTLDLIDRGDLDCSSVRQVVLVEGDTMLGECYG